MQTNFGVTDASLRSMQELSWKVLVSFDRDFDAGIDFFTIGSSSIEGTDMLPGTNNVIQEWDKYLYEDFSDRVISIKWEKELDPVSSIVSATADITLNNYDDALSEGFYVYTSRPVKIFFGYNGEVLPQFVGVTKGNPVIDDDLKTVQYHCTDFMAVLLDKQINTIVGSQDVRTDEALATVFEEAGLLSTQYEFDIGFNIVPFFYGEKGLKLRSIASKLMVAEQGRLFMDEEGMLRFHNRQHYDPAIVQTFNAYDSIVESVRPQHSDIVNVVTGEIKIRDVQPNQLIYQSSEVVEVPAGGTVDVWAGFADPTVAVDTPVYIDSASTSSFTVNTQPDGLGSADPSSVTIDSSTLFSDSYLIVFENTASSPRYITDLKVFGESARVVSSSDIREEDAASILQFEEQIEDISSDFFRSVDEAQSKASVLIADYADNIDAATIRVKGNPALQLGDVISVDIFGRYGTYMIVKIANQVKDSEYVQRLRIKSFSPVSYFSIEGSQIGGTDQLAP